MRRTILLALAATAVGMQFIRPSHATAAHDPTADLIVAEKPDPEVARLLHEACYDCHSDRSTLPWYASITPVNFWLQHHVNEGREEFNMATWMLRSAQWRQHKAGEAVREINKVGMPLPSYTWMHKEARLTSGERERLAEFFRDRMH